ncbi:aromatase/cyclase [Dactylosporangium roseum]|uniref:Aromatase/cyclase n=2 Tax=Dactylosporangium roseum TaxID=47989 RepID=A0ABY5ZIJ5_9ACTN|nr:aromatase/cyclase [Dactylosporangium roseum]
MEHYRVVAAPPERLYDLVTDVTRWPVILGPCVEARRLEIAGDEERIEISADVNGEVKTWTSRRTLDPAGLRVAFRQERSAPPIAAMSGAWSFAPEGDGQTRMTLTHAFSALTGDRKTLNWIAAAVDRNSEQELAALGAVAALGHPLDRLVFSFSDRVELPGVAAADAYDFVHRADRWPRRLPHVRRVDVDEAVPGVQRMEMETLTADGGSHTTQSIRLCSPGERIAYKQTVLPALLSGHSGVWEFEAVAGGAAITSRHTVAIDPAAVEAVLGAGTTLEKAGAWAREALGANSRATMAAAGS